MYRIYESLEAGAVPVIHDIQPSTAAQCSSRPYRLLKALGAPVLWVNDWQDLAAILDTEAK